MILYTDFSGIIVMSRIIGEFYVVSDFKMK